MCFRILFSVKNIVGILIGIAVTLRTAFGRTLNIAILLL